MKSITAVKMMRITTALHPIMLFIGLLTYFPIIFLLLTSNIMHTKTTGRSIPLRTCDQSEIQISGAFGNKIIAAEIAIIPV